MRSVVTYDDTRLPIALWLNNLEEGAMGQARNLANLPYAFHHIAVMADGHKGYGMPIGGVMATSDALVPNAVGADIGCGMRAMRLSLTNLSPEVLRMVVGGIKARVPVGIAKHPRFQEWEGFDRAPHLEPIVNELRNACSQLGTLGSGNHFIEIQKGSDGYIWVMLHSGSRHMGYAVAKYYNALAQKLCLQWHSNVPEFKGEDGLAFFPMSSTEGREYRKAMNFCLEFAKESRARMMASIRDAFVFALNGDVEFMEEHDVHHNYAQYENHFGKNVIVHRKGATSAKEGEIGIIPGSQSTSSFIVTGLGNKMSFNSCSHGAGRAMSRKAAKRDLNLATELKLMEGIVHDMDAVEDLEEAGAAYKDIHTVMENQKDLVRIRVQLLPLAVIKGKHKRMGKGKND